MRISLCNEVIAELPFARQCELAREMGYDGLEIAPFTLGPDPLRLSETELAGIRRAAADAGIAITGLHYLLRAPAGLSITSADEDVRERTVAVMRGLCRLAADLGAHTLVHGSPDQRQLAPGEEAEGRRRARDCFAAAADAAAQAGVLYCIEALSPNQTNFINTVEEAAAIVREVGHPSLKTMIDCSSAGLAEAEPVATLIKRWLPAGLIGHVHFNDPNRRGPGDGAMEFGPILMALRGYRGDAAVEPFVYEPDGPGCARRNITYLRSLLEKLPK
jgi:D-psicose/D-tagatose/L-ribulose 3-epimerase